jgi:hypothetical protein
MHRLTTLSLAFAAVTTLLLASVANAAASIRETFSFPYAYVDTETCGFPIAVEGVFTNMIIDSAVASGTGTLELHQSDVATSTANGVTLRTNVHYTIFVTFVDGVPVSAKHVGLVDDITGPNGDHLFFRTGQAVYQVVFDPDLGSHLFGDK